MNIYLARQPIFDKEENVLAYEVLYRSSFANAFDGSDGDRATSEVILNTFQVIGIENLSNRKPVFVNFTETLLFEEIATLIPNRYLVVEILEEVPPREGILEKCRELKKRGYRIALDDFKNLPDYKPLLDLADIVKIDFLGAERCTIEDILHRLAGSRVEWLAEKVETREEFEYAKGLGFKYFQGYFFSKPEVVSSKKVVPLKTNYLRLINLISGRGELDFERIDEIISGDLSLTYNLLKLVNSVVFGARFRIERTKQALVFLGEREIKKWIWLMILTEIGQDKPDELTRLSLIRARFLELMSLGSNYQEQSEELFLIGLFSLLDALLSRPLQDILAEIKASDLITGALLNRGGELDQFFRMALFYEKGEWERAFSLARSLSLGSRLMATSYSGALEWYNMLITPRK